MGYLRTSTGFSASRSRDGCPVEPDLIHDLLEVLTAGPAGERHKKKKKKRKLLFETTRATLRPPDVSRRHPLNRGDWQIGAWASGGSLPIGGIYVPSEKSVMAGTEIPADMAHRSSARSGVSPFQGGFCPPEAKENR